jgi:hypothetical protein
LPGQTKASDRNSPGESVTEVDAVTAIRPSEFCSHRAKAVKLPAPPGLLNALPEAVQVFFPTGLLVVVQERSPPDGGVNGGETAKPPPVTWDFPVQFADVVAVPPDAIGTVELRVVAAALLFDFFATAGEAGPIASTTHSAIAGVSQIRWRDRSLSVPGKVGRSYPSDPRLPPERRVRCREARRPGEKG